MSSQKYEFKFYTDQDVDIPRHSRTKFTKDMDIEYSNELKIITFCYKQQQKRIKWNLKTKTVVTEVMSSAEDSKPNFCVETC